MGLKKSVQYVFNKFNFLKKKRDEHTVLPTHGQEGSSSSSSRHSFAGMKAAFSRSLRVTNPGNIGEPRFHREGSSSLAPPRRSFAEGSSRNFHGGVPSQDRPKDHKSRAQQKREFEREMRDMEKEDLQADEDAYWDWRRLERAEEKEQERLEKKRAKEEEKEQEKERAKEKEREQEKERAKEKEKERLEKERQDREGRNR